MAAAPSVWYVPDNMRAPDELLEKLLVDLGMALVLREVTDVMRFRENTRDGRAQAYRMRERLENNITVF
jgi:hypothetical protein